jgi:hypothetical protein
LVELTQKGYQSAGVIAKRGSERWSNIHFGFSRSNGRDGARPSRRTNPAIRVFLQLERGSPSPPLSEERQNKNCW